MLDSLAGRIASTNLKGCVTINGQKVDKASFRRLTGYVMQDDALFPMLTVRETFLYAARLRLGDSKGEAELERVVEDTIEMLNLRKAADTIIGDELNRGISGGEKRRVYSTCPVPH